ncbi:GNAT family N-acetyltransferase [Paenibacillus chartarius]|uniref:GNAT family N-acetyltransferase n=1 Tax=Paenibacillus chartarius TaxID=747481 RepID=A0ABV6DNV1_9BACL
MSRGKVHRVNELQGYAALLNGVIKASVSYYVDNWECEIVSLESAMQNQGLGSKLVQLVVEQAKERQCKRVWLITSNDNVRAIRFYQKRGFDMKAIHYDAITEARKLKPAIPLIGDDGIPVRHEVEFEMILSS